MAGNINYDSMFINPEKLLFLEIMIGMLAKLYKYSEKVNSNQIKVVKKFLKKELRLNEEDYELAAIIFCETIINNRTLESYAINFANTIGKDQEVRLEMIEWLYSMAMADGKIDFLKSKKLLKICKIFGFSETEHKRLSGLHKTGQLKYYKILHCSPEDSDEKIKRTYKRLLFDFHPDHLLFEELPEIYLQFAKQKLQEINEAYTQLKLIRGFS